MDDHDSKLRDREAGNLTARRASGGPVALARQPFFLGINDPVGLNPAGAQFDSHVFTIFRPWLALHGDDDVVSKAHRSITRGAEVFNTKPITIAGVGGLNNQTFSNGVFVGDPLPGTCSKCHDSPNAGNHSVKAPLDIGLTDPSVAAYLPVYTLRNIATGQTVETTDPGRAMKTGKWANRFHIGLTPQERVDLIAFLRSL